MKKQTKRFVGDFETTVYDGQTTTEVWASANVEIGTEDVHLFGSIEDTLKYYENMKEDIIVYYHNLKFDGSFWLDYLLRVAEYKTAFDGTSMLKRKGDMPRKSFSYSVSDMGLWYTMHIYTRYGYMIELRDSLKLLPFSVAKIGKDFRTKHQKLEMEYTGYRYPNCYISPEEQEYIKNDVLVIAEALQMMFDEGHDKLTIGSCCLAEYKKIIEQTGYGYFELFPQLYDIPLDESFGEPTVGAYIHNSYRGGWCYVVKGREKKRTGKGITADVNSLYPSVMSSESGSYYPVGKPAGTFKDFIPDKLYQLDGCGNPWYYFVRFQCSFKIKKDYLPFVQIKHTLLYNSREMLETSDVHDKRTGEWYHYEMVDGKKQPITVTMTMTQTDFKLFLEHYDVDNMKILDGIYFHTMNGIFDLYIEKYKKIKMESKGAKRAIAKLFLNNLYGKMASSDVSSFKVAYMDEEGNVRFWDKEAHDKVAGYIAIGSAITSYAKNFTIRAAQKNFHGRNKRGFIYADTDSIHCDLNADELIDVPVHPNAFCHWKLESTWDYGWFVRAKTYIEHVIEEDQEPVTPYLNVKCAGLPELSKRLFVASVEGYDQKYYDELPHAYQEFVSTKRTIEEFNVGLQIPGKLMPKRITGGVLLVDTYFEMRQKA